MAVALTVVGCGSSATPATAPTVLVKARSAVAIVAMPDGGVRFAERVTGRIRDVDRRGRPAARDVARVDVSSRGQRGLLGLAVDRGKTFAAWTTTGDRLVVGQVAPGPLRLVWNGPPSRELANGGHLVVAPSGRLIIGIGDLEDRNRTRDPASPNGKLLSLNPDGPAEQLPMVVSSGWNNPFAFTFTSRGELWVADNSPADEPERLARGDLGPGPSRVTELGRHTVPAGLVALRHQRLVLCRYATHRLTRFRVDATGRARPDRSVLAGDCSGPVAAQADGRLIFGTPPISRIRPAVSSLSRTATR